MNDNKSLIEWLKKCLDDDELMFKLGTGTKFLLVSLVCTLSVLLFTYLFLRIDLIFFVTNGYPGAAEFEDAFYDFIYSSLFDSFWWMGFSGVFIFSIGYYLSAVMIRPFKAIGQYCEDRVNDKKNYYTPDFFSDLKLLTSFSVFFFSRVDEAQIVGKFKPVEIPNHFTRIHKPNFEKNFFFNYLFIIAIFALLSSVGMLSINNEIRDQIFELSRKLLGNNKQALYFLDQQFAIANIAVYFFVILHLILYLLLGLHLYSKVATPAFAVFATMRSFLKGNYHNRIHLIGFYYLRDDCRKMNKFLDYLQKNLT